MRDLCTAEGQGAPSLELCSVRTAGPLLWRQIAGEGLCARRPAASLRSRPPFPVCTRLPPTLFSSRPRTQPWSRDRLHPTCHPAIFSTACPGVPVQPQPPAPVPESAECRAGRVRLRASCVQSSRHPCGVRFSSSPAMPVPVHTYVPRTRS
ncbi:hypothetical protein P7K49_036397 [Saguinus oedipus]|uniref:Uncharacterized protein n=1 Tax=Saguinus oedipus TaxID=9490 RepID=A0ABQ9TK02_SAGOE|nr:hypothetical protein P7K49_036397 [Saguinus oedipus]